MLSLLAGFDAANLAFNMFTLAALVVGGLISVKTFSPKRAAAVAEEKDLVIATHVQTIEALRQRDLARESELSHVRGKATKAEERMISAAREASVWRGRYEEQQQYTAGPALQTIQQMIEAQQNESERRHKELIKALERIAPSPATD